MTPGYTIHTTDTQPPETRGKFVKYRLFESDRFGHFKADQLNWKTSGEGAPISGRIVEYKITQ